MLEATRWHILFVIPGREQVASLMPNTIPNKILHRNRLSLSYCAIHKPVPPELIACFQRFQPETTFVVEFRPPDEGGAWPGHVFPPLRDIFGPDTIRLHTTPFTTRMAPFYAFLFLLALSGIGMGFCQTRAVSRYSWDEVNLTCQLPCSYGHTWTYFVSLPGQRCHRME